VWALAGAQSALVARTSLADLAAGHLASDRPVWPAGLALDVCLAARVDARVPGRLLDSLAVRAEPCGSALGTALAARRGVPVLHGVRAGLPGAGNGQIPVQWRQAQGAGSTMRRRARVFGEVFAPSSPIRPLTNTSNRDRITARKGGRRGSERALSRPHTPRFCHATTGAVVPPGLPRRERTRARGDA